MNDVHYPYVVSLLHFDTDPIVDQRSLGWAKQGPVNLTTINALFGSSMSLGTNKSLLGNSVYLALAPDSIWTVELFVRPNSLSFSKNGLFFNGDPGSNNSRYQLEANSDGSVGLYIQQGGGTGSVVALSPPGALQIGQWNHVAVCRNGQQYTLWINGQPSGSGLYSVIVSADNNFYLGLTRSAGTQWYFDGLVDEFRLTKGIERYKTAFTPATEPFPNQRPPYEISIAQTFGRSVELACYTIYGNLDNVDDTPAAACRVHLLAEDRLTYKSSTMTDALGQFHFFAPDFGVKKYSVICYDKTGLNRAVIGNDVTAELV
ncbi:LamG domain-containing protein [Arsukibacterium sp.]|uniref:LamG domain-containing protein n=1 Tax=Arsukibacterium sp. TaxID=1977258 RepID=UPI00299E800E|nr:LamG domain-containing protein [Arsukibacterium sp.]MDX1536404.1 LamG domain-containing protein [Arsukibacterium sp.]